MEVRNRFKGLDLIDRVPDELWNEVCDIVQETGVKTIPMDAGLLLGRTERAARAAELQLCAQAR